jgi:hypothetical protein
MQDAEWREVVLKALWKHRHEGLVNFDEALKDLFIPFDLKRGILRQLNEGGLIRYEHEPLSGSLGSGRITFDGALHEHWRSTQDQRQRHREDIASDQARAVQVEGAVEWISNLLKSILRRLAPRR